MEEKRKYLEYFDGAFDSTVAEKIQPENWPYVAYSTEEGVIYTIIPKEEGTMCTYNMVDLGLPSGLKWADRNVGAETPQDNGLYFSWGNVDGHTVDENGNVADSYSFDENTYSNTIGGQYTGSTLDQEHDAATVNMSSKYRMPTIDELLEIRDNTTQIFIDLDGNEYVKGTDSITIEMGKLKGVKFTGPNGNSIFIPAAGYCYESLLTAVGINGMLWSSSLDNNSDDNAKSFVFAMIGVVDGSNIPCYSGLPIRGVQS